MGEELLDEFEQNEERLNDIEAHYQSARWDMPEWQQLQQRQRELAAILYPTGEIEANEWLLCPDESDGEIERKEHDGWQVFSVTPVWAEDNFSRGIKWAVAYRRDKASASRQTDHR